MRIVNPRGSVWSVVFFALLQAGCGGGAGQEDSGNSSSSSSSSSSQSSSSNSCESTIVVTYPDGAVESFEGCEEFGVAAGFDMRPNELPELSAISLAWTPYGDLFDCAIQVEQADVCGEGFYRAETTVVGQLEIRDCTEAPEDLAFSLEASKGFLALERIKTVSKTGDVRGEEVQLEVEGSFLLETPEKLTIEGRFSFVEPVVVEDEEEAELLNCPVFDGDQFQSVTTGRGATDLLFVVDNSCSMEDNQVMLQGMAPDLFQQLEGLDYRVGVVSTDMENPDYSGRLVGTAITPNTDSPASAFQGLVSLGTSGSNDEKGLDAAKAAVESDYAKNKNFFREQADLEIVVLSDADDFSNIFPADFIDWAAALKQTFTTSLSAMVGMDQCASNIEGNGTRYINVAEALDGFSAPICDSEASRMALVQHLEDGREYQVALEPSADVTSLRVYVEEPADTWTLLDADEYTVDGEMNFAYRPTTRVQSLVLGYAIGSD